MVASGTATLEAAFLRLPYVLVYRVAWLTSFVGRRLIRVPFLGIVNILAGREVVREFVQSQARPGAIAAEVLRLLENADARDDLVKQLDSVVGKLGGPGASERAATAILAELNAR
ncbi:MAG: lipid-A-disaccharide synthase, partial [Verrucomicrobiota bacterium]|nr:lipid-A-disaccharide synthase [Verrucomicrobiota bacterium]